MTEVPLGGRPPDVRPAAPVGPDLNTVGALLDLSGTDMALQQAKQALAKELADPAGPGDFSPDGAKELIIQNGEYIKELGLRSIRQARKAGLDTVSRKHVRDAVDDLREAGGSMVQVAALALGGLAGGAGLQEFVDLVNSTGPIAKQEVVVSGGYSSSAPHSSCWVSSGAAEVSRARVDG